MSIVCWAQLRGGPVRALVWMAAEGSAWAAAKVAGA